ncbi:MAG: DALR anticodon-binding domain-containing protein, partial [Mucinivorans sp.]
EQHSPAVIAAYAYELAKEYNQYYHDFPVLRSDVELQDRAQRLLIASQVATMISRAMGLLGINSPERM